MSKINKAEALATLGITYEKGSRKGKTYGRNAVGQANVDLVAKALKGKTEALAVIPQYSANDEPIDPKSLPTVPEQLTKVKLAMTIAQTKKWVTEWAKDNNRTAVDHENVVYVLAAEKPKGKTK